MGMQSQWQELGSFPTCGFDFLLKLEVKSPVHNEGAGIGVRDKSGGEETTLSEVIKS